MKVLESTTEKRTTTLKVELDAAELEAAGEETYKRLNKEIVVPGFRKGKAPKQLLINHVGKDAFNNEVYEDYVPIACDKVITDEKIEIYARPYIHVISEDPVTFEAIIPLTPVVELGDYKGVRIDVVKPEVKEEEVEECINRIRKQNGKWTETENPVEDGDIVNCDVDSKSGDEPFIQQKAMPFQITKGSDYPAPGFSEQLIGMKKGEEKTFTLKFNDKSDVDSEEEKERDIDFTVKVNEIRTEEMAELTDDFVKTVMPSCENVDGFKEVIRHELLHRELDRVKGECTDKVLAKLVEQSKLEYPDFLVEREIDAMVEEYDERVRNSVSSQEDYDTIMNTTNYEELRKNYKESAENRVKNNLVVSKVMNEENIDTTDEEIDAQLKTFASDAPDPEKRYKMLNSDENRANIRNWSNVNKAMKFLLDTAIADWPEEDRKTLAHTHEHHHED